jgi:hypothetical protein
MIDPNLSRWILASVSKYIADRKGNVDLEIEGQTNLKDGQLVWYELILDGPTYNQVDHIESEYFVSILMGVAAIVTPEDTHILRRHHGIVQSILTEQPIPIRRFGDGNDDDQTQIGCLFLRTDVPRPIDGMILGRVSDESQLHRATVEGHYKLSIDNL